MSLNQIQTEEPCWSSAEPLVPSVNMHPPTKPACQSPSPSASRSIIVRDRRLSRRGGAQAGMSWMVHGVGRRGRVGGPEGCRCSLHRISGWCKVVRRRRRCLCGAAVHGLGTT